MPTENILYLYDRLTKTVTPHNIVETAALSLRTARVELVSEERILVDQILRRIRYQKLGERVFPRFWVESYAPRGIVLASMLRNIVLSGVDDLDVVRAGLVARYLNFIPKEDPRRVAKHVDALIEKMEKEKVLKIEGNKVRLETDNLNDFVKAGLKQVVDRSTLMISIARRMLALSILDYFAEMRKDWYIEVVQQLAAETRAWTKREQLEKDLNVILNEYMYYLHVIEAERSGMKWIVKSNVKALSDALEELPVPREVCEALKNALSGLNIVTVGLIEASLIAQDIDPRIRIMARDLAIGLVAKLAKAGEYTFTHDPGTLVRADILKAVRSYVADQTAVHAALDTAKRLIEKMPITTTPNGLRQLMAELIDELLARGTVEISKLSDRELASRVLVELFESGIVDLSPDGRSIVVIDPQALAIVGVLVGACDISKLVLTVPVEVRKEKKFAKS